MGRMVQVARNECGELKAPGGNDLGACLRAVRCR